MTHLHEVLDTDLVEYVLVVVPELGSLSMVVPALSELVEAESIRILDVVCLNRGAADSRLTVLEIEDLDAMSVLADVEGEFGSMLSTPDIEAAASGLTAGSSAVLLLVEDRWAKPLSSAARNVGGRFVGGERVAPRRLEAVLEVGRQ